MNEIDVPPDGQQRRGENHQTARCSDAILREVIALKRAGYATTQISNATGVSVTQIKNVVRGASCGYLQASAPPDIRDAIAACPDVGAALRSARLQRGLTQHQLSYAVRVYENTVRVW